MLPIDFARRINRTPSYVYGLVNGRHFKPPKDAAALREWAVVLGLSQPATRRFLLAAALERCPIEVRDEFRRLRRLERAGRR